MDNPFLGQIQLFAFGYAPEGWLLCDGSLLSVPQYSALFSLLGARFGGNGTSNFGIPNLIAAQPIVKNTPFMRYYISTVGIYPQRS